jgi:hypothetical protein
MQYSTAVPFRLLQVILHYLTFLHECFELLSKYYLGFELAVGGELFECIGQRGHFSERDAVAVVRYVRTVFSHR